MGCFSFSPYAFPPGSRRSDRGPFGSARDNADYERERKRQERSEATEPVLASGCCMADITHRDEEHRQSVCILPGEHAGPHDDGAGCAWTDAEHHDGGL